MAPLPHSPVPRIYRFLIVLHKGLLGEGVEWERGLGNQEARG